MIVTAAGGPPAFLASVTNVAEAATALANGADIIDCKNPAAGALGALDADVISAIVAGVDQRLTVSATVGDLPADGDMLLDAVERTAAAGVDIVKVGFFGDGDSSAAIERLATAKLPTARLMAVLMADRAPDFSLLSRLADAGFLGVMLDTAGKTGLSLTSIMTIQQIKAFVLHAKRRDLIAGLAGSLTSADVAPLAACQPDVLGFRGALCANGRTSPIDALRVAHIRVAIDDTKPMSAQFTVQGAATQ